MNEFAGSYVEKPGIVKSPVVQCLCVKNSNEIILEWNEHCPFHGFAENQPSTTAGTEHRIRVELEALINEFRWSATVPRHRIREILDGNL